MKKCCIFVLFILIFSLAPASTTASPVEIKYFYSPSCSHCRVVSGVMEDISDIYGSLVYVNKINVALAENQDIWNQYKMQFTINGVPTIIINDEFKLEGDIKITVDNVSDIVDELLLGMDSRGDELYNMGTSALQSGQFEVAISYYEQAIEIYELSNNTTKIGLCNQKILEASTHMEAENTYVSAETLYYAASYAEALPLYEEVIALYESIGATSFTKKSEIRKQSCLFFITYEAAMASYNAGSWQEAAELFTEVLGYTSDSATIASINEYIDFAETQLDAEDIFSQAEAAFSEGRYVEAKLLFQDASRIFSSADAIALCNERIQLCDAYTLASDTFDYGVSLYDEGSYQEAVAVFGSAKQKYVVLGDTQAVSECDTYIGLSQNALAELERKALEEERARQDARNKKMLLAAAISALGVIIVALVLLLFTRRPPSALVDGGSAVDESEDSTEDEEDESESQEVD